MKKTKQNKGIKKESNACHALFMRGHCYARSQTQRAAVPYRRAYSTFSCLCSAVGRCACANSTVVISSRLHLAHRDATQRCIYVSLSLALRCKYVGEAASLQRHRTCRPSPYLKAFLHWLQFRGDQWVSMSISSRMLPSAAAVHLNEANLQWDARKRTAENSNSS